MARARYPTATVSAALSGEPIYPRTYSRGYINANVPGQEDNLEVQARRERLLKDGGVEAKVVALTSTGAKICLTNDPVRRTLVCGAGEKVMLTQTVVVREGSDSEPESESWELLMTIPPRKGRGKTWCSLPGQTGKGRHYRPTNDVGGVTMPLEYFQ